MSAERQEGAGEGRHGVADRVAALVHGLLGLEPDAGIALAIGLDDMRPGIVEELERGMAVSLRRRGIGQHLRIGREMVEILETGTAGPQRPAHPPVLDRRPP
ncbi:hypothetical protein QO058_26425 [Bosea vestrisii]|nr:hypothetical protein [Bosea vestrisii]WID96224.1 hypothetical protein QO058_26425 [Bosea vestrisii]